MKPSDLPKNPKDAIRVLLIQLLGLLPGTSLKVGDLERNTLSQVSMLARIALLTSKRAGDIAFEEIATSNLVVSFDQKCVEYRKDLDQTLDALLILDLDEHFLDNDDIGQYDQAHLSNEEKASVRTSLEEARLLTNAASFLSNDHKKRILHRISRVENELYKEIAGFPAFLAAAAEATGLVKKFGNDAKPLAEAIQLARTTTERKVTGYAQIAADAKPKALPKPEESERG